MKIFEGKVVLANQQKGATVEVTRIVMHPLYKKRFKRSKKYHVQDELGVKIGDIVTFIATKPYSKTKKWKILKIISSVAIKGGKSK